MTYTQDNGLAELAKKIEILNSPLDIDRKRDIIVLNTTESSDNKKNDRSRERKKFYRNNTKEEGRYN